MTRRREFIAQLGTIATGISLNPKGLKPGAGLSESEWDTSWIESLRAAQFRVVFNASEISDGIAMDYAATFLDHFHEVHATRDQQMRPVIVFRRLGTVMAFNDVLWDRYALGAERKVNDPATKAPATRNIFWKAPGGSSAGAVATKIETLQKRGLISLVCSISIGSFSGRIADQTKRNVDEVRAEVLANLLPGVIPVPSGIYGLIRAQNAGCAFMPGT
jgi:intracellular sulfur oxidation DsrE/DsrF family protein